MARITGTKNVTNNSFQTVASTGSVVISAGSAANSGTVYIDSKTGSVNINDGGGKVDINKGGGIVNINDNGGTLTVDGLARYDGIANVGSIGNPSGDPQLDIDQTLFSTTAQRELASVYFKGGVGIEQDLSVGGIIYGRISQALTTTNVIVTATNDNNEFYPIFVDQFTATGTVLYGDNDATDLRYNPSLGRLTVNKERIVSTETSTSTDTGALQVAGGIGVAQDITVGGVVYGYNNFTTQYLESIYDKYLGLPAAQSKIVLAAGATDVFGEIQVRGKNPIGTAPVVTNVLYVTVDGNDTNDGRAQDPSRACRTIGGALKSPYYQPGTQIRVSAGRYLENNPLELKPYTSIMGSDIRTTFIEPINKTQDLFHLTSGCYLAFMTFLNGRSGKLRGDYALGTNRGAYATAFPPQTGENRIDLFHSPYVQNCTNQSGPWLNDGTMFIPSQTVQIPAAVGTGTWAANTTSIVVYASTGTIQVGQYINAGQQNPGFFNARTLLLANKPFLQSQVVAFVDATFNSGSFSYNQTKCRRDTALILNAIAKDALYDSESDSTFSGLQYWSQGGYTGDIPNEITATIAAITFLNSIAQTYVDPAVITTVDSLFTTVTNILSNGTVGVSDWVNYGGLPSTATTIVTSYNSLQTNKNIMQHDVLDWIAVNYPALVFNTTTCFRDVGYIIDGVSFDLLHGSNVQSIKSGVYYYTYSTTATTIPNEVPQTTAAYNYIKSILPNIVTATPLPTTYQTGTTQVLVGNPGDIYDAGVLESKLDVITKIIRNGPGVAPELEPINLTQNTATSLLNSYNLLLANTAFIQEEVIAYIDATMNNFQYNRQKCYRDVAILVENMAYDMVYGGNQKSIESGLAYYEGVVSVIAGQETQTMSAIDYLSELCKQVVVNSTCTVLPVPLDIPSNPQVFNTVLIGGDIAIDPIEKLFNITVDIIEDGPSAAPPVYTSTGPDAAFVSAEILMQANRTFIQENTLNYINHVLCNPPKALPYNQIKCRRDARVILDSVASDMYFGGYNSQSNFAGRQYFAIDGYTGSIKTEIQPTIRAVRYLRDMSLKVVQSITTATDAQAGITRYSTGTQFTSTNIASEDALKTIELEFTTILNILGGHVTDWTGNIVPNGGTPSNLSGVNNAIELLQNNRIYLQQEILAYITATNAGFVFDQATCERDIGYMVDAVTFDLKYGGNRMAVQSGLGYYDNVGTENVVEGEVTATIAAFNYMISVAGDLIIGNDYTPLQTTVKPVKGLSTGTVGDATKLSEALTTITNIILNGPGVAGPQMPSLLTPVSTATINAFEILRQNREFLAAETVAWLDLTYNPGAFNYDQDLCYRDTGLIVDAVSQDILLGGNQKSLEAGLSYWNKGYNYVSGQITTTTAAINYARDISLQIIANQPVTPTTGTVTKQIINPFFEYGDEYMPQESVTRNFGIVTNIIENGPSAAPPSYAGGGLFALTGLNGSDVLPPPKVTRVDVLSTGTYLVGLSTSTIGFGLNATLYFGNVLVFPLQDNQVEELSLQYTGSTSTWNIRKVDPIGAMGGSLVDGAVISERSPIQSFVYDAFTQVSQGGIGIHITNNGYAQLVSVFTIFNSIGVFCENGGIASITNSNCNFGDISIMSKGYGPRKFSGTVFNPAFRAYPFSPQGIDPLSGDPLPYLDQFYPTGFWPNLGRVEVFVPDEDDRPHIGLVMEVIPPDGHINEQGFPGFLNAQPSTSTLATGTIVLSNISTEDVSIGNTLFIRDQFGKEFDDFPYLHDPDGNPVDAFGNRLPDPSLAPPNPNYLKWYAGTGTVVTDVNYNAITLNQALENGGGDPLNPTYFTLYFCGNSYYTVQTSTRADNPYQPNTNKLAANSDPYYQGPATSQVVAHIDSLTHLKNCVADIIANVAITPTTGNTATQVINTTVIGGLDAKDFIDLRMGYITSIVGAANLSAANAVVPPLLRVKDGPQAPGSGAAVTLIELNIDFLAAEVAAYAVQNWITELNTSQQAQRAKCERDVKIILQAMIYDLESGGNYESVFAGLSYWMIPGTYHVVTLGEAVRRPDLFPDGSTVNFYQRSYISASGYLFEYVGAGTNYGALPQRGVADPDQLKEVVQLNNGKVFFTSTDQNGDFRIGPGLVIAQATGVLTGRTFVQSLYANMTPFILAIE